MEDTIQIEDEIEFLDVSGLKITRNSFSEMVLETHDGTVHTGVTPVRAFPLTRPDEFIIFVDEDKNEIGIIEHTKQLKKNDRRVLEEELELCYFMPQITKVNNLTGRYGVTKWSVETNRGPVEFDIRSRYDIVTLGGGRLVIRDVDGNRYEIANSYRLDAKSQALLETQI